MMAMLGTIESVPSAFTTAGIGNDDGLLNQAPAGWVDFGQGDDILSWLTFGWGGREADSIWTHGRRSELTLPEAFGGMPFGLELDVRPWIKPPLIRGQVLRISVNGRRLGSYQLVERRVIRCRVDQAMLRFGKPVVVTFEQPCFARPDILANDPPAARGVALHALRVVYGLTFGSVAKSPPVSVDQAPIFPDEAHDAATEPKSLAFDFATTEPSIPHEGWYRALDNNFWSTRAASSLTLPAPPGKGPYQLRILVAPQVNFLAPDQRISIVLNGFVISQFRTRTETSFVVALPAEVIGEDETMELVFQTPDGICLDDFAAPADFGTLGFVLERIVLEPVATQALLIERLRDEEAGEFAPLAVSDQFLKPLLGELPGEIEAGLGVKLAEILKQFESLGDSCNFGLAQRKAGVEVLQLLRFGNTPVQALQRAFDDDFQALSPGSTGVSVERGKIPPWEFYVTINRYGMRWHTLRYPDSSTAEEIFEDHVVRLRYLRQKFYQGIRSQRKIYVIIRATPDRVVFVTPRIADIAALDDRLYYFVPAEPLRLAEVAPVLQYLSRFGHNRLLYVVPSKPGKSSGTVELLAPGLMKGYLDQLTISDDPAVHDHAGWLRVVANAWRLDRGDNAAAPAQTLTPAAGGTWSHRRVVEQLSAE